MDYEAVAEELLDIHSELSRLSVNQQMDGIVRGEDYALTYLATHGGTCQPKDLSKGMGVSSARVAAILNQLEGKGMVQRSSDTEHVRQTIVTLTDVGSQWLIGRKKELISSLVDLLKDMGEEDALDLLRLRKKMLALEHHADLAGT